MRKFSVLLILLILFAGIIVSSQEPNVSVGAGDVKQIQGAIGELPINESGQIDFNKYQPFKTKADERIEKINSYIGPITNALWGVKLSLSWLFVFSVIMWLLLIELIVMPVKEIFGFNAVGSFIVATIIASLSMQSFGKTFVVWIDSLATQWWIAAITIFTVIIIGFIYSIIMRYLGVKFKFASEASKKAQTDIDRKIIHVDAEVSEKRLKDI